MQRNRKVACAVCDMMYSPAVSKNQCPQCGASAPKQPRFEQTMSLALSNTGGSMAPQGARAKASCVYCVCPSLALSPSLTAAQREAPWWARRGPAT